MARKRGDRVYTIDHANKLKDRQRANPNRRLLLLMRSGDVTPDALADATRAGSKRKDPK